MYQWFYLAYISISDSYESIIINLENMSYFGSTRGQNMSFFYGKPSIRIFSHTFIFLYDTVSIKLGLYHIMIRVFTSEYPWNCMVLLIWLIFQSTTSRVKKCESRAYHRIVMKKTHFINSSSKYWIDTVYFFEQKHGI